MDEMARWLERSREGEGDEGNHPLGAAVHAWFAQVLM